jgi:single-stranded-DNA-specific exonuclease
MLERGRAFLQTSRPRWLLAPDGDVDGLTAGLLLQRTLERLGASQIEIALATKDEKLFSRAFLDRMAAAAPSALVLLDQGSRPEPLLDEVPTLIIDHHFPAGFPPGALAVTAHGCEPVASSSLLTYELCRTLVDLEDLSWLALLGTAADLSLDAPFPSLFAPLAELGRKNVTEAIALLNAPRRSSSGDPRLAWEALSQARSPEDLAKGRVPGVEALREARREVNAEISRSSRAAPKFSGPVALISLDSPAKVHSLMAARWSHRLPKYIALAANRGYRPGRVHFSMRTRTPTDLIAFLRRLELDLGPEFANGHPQATGGNLSADDFDRLLAALGFAPGAFAPLPDYAH